MQHLSALLPPETPVRVDDGPIPALVLGTSSTFEVHLWTANHRGVVANADLWRRIAAAATELAVRCDDLAATAEVTA